MNFKSLSTIKKLVMLDKINILKFIYAYSNLLIKVILGPINILVMLFFFDQYSQGVYYLLLSTLSILQIGELGFLNIILNEADKTDYEQNSQKHLTGREIRTSNNLTLVKQTTIYFFTIGMIFSMVIVMFFLGNYKISSVNIIFFLSLFFNFLNFSISPYLFIVEGSGFIKDAFKIRAIILVVSSVLAILFVVVFKNVYVILFNASVIFLMNFYFFNRIFGFRNLLNIKRNDFKETFVWVKSKFGFQIKLAIAYLLGQSTYSFYQFVIYKNISIEAVGRFGVSYTIITFLTGIICLFATVKYSYVSALYTRKQYDLVKENFYMDRKRMLILSAAIIPVAVGGYFMLGYLFPAKMKRIVDLNTFLVFLVAIVFSSLANLIAQYTRANNTELMFWENLFVSVLQYAFAFVLTWKFHLIGLAFAYMLSYVLTYLLYHRKFERYINRFVQLAATS